MTTTRTPLLCVSSILLYIGYILYVLPIHSFRFIKHQEKSQPHKDAKFINLTYTDEAFRGYKTAVVWLYYILVGLCRFSLVINSQRRLPRSLFKKTRCILYHYLNVKPNHNYSIFQTRLYTHYIFFLALSGPKSLNPFWAVGPWL